MAKFTHDQVREIARKHRLRGEPRLQPTLGMVNEVWILENFVLRLCLDEEAEKDARIEAAVVPLARSAGVRTPRLLVLDEHRDVVPFSLTVYERARGVTLGTLEPDLPRMEGALLELGRELPRLHEVKLEGLRPDLLAKPERANCDDQLLKLRQTGRVPAEECDWLAELLDRLRPHVPEQLDTLIHDDLHAWNVLVDEETLELTAILDWGDAGYGDPATDFAAVPILALPAMLSGYRDAGGFVDEQFGARLLWQMLGCMMWEKRVLADDWPDFNPKWSVWLPEGVPRFRQSLSETPEQCLRCWSC